MRSSGRRLYISLNANCSVYSRNRILQCSGKLVPFVVIDKSNVLHNNISECVAARTLNVIALLCSHKAARCAGAPAFAIARSKHILAKAHLTHALISFGTPATPSPPIDNRLKPPTIYLYLYPFSLSLAPSKIPPTDATNSRQLPASSEQLLAAV